MHATLTHCVTHCEIHGMTHLLPRLHGFDEFKAGVMRIEGISEAPQQLPIITAKARAEA